MIDNFSSVVKLANTGSMEKFLKKAVKSAHEQEQFVSACEVVVDLDVDVDDDVVDDDVVACSVVEVEVEVGVVAVVVDVVTVAGIVDVVDVEVVEDVVVVDVVEVEVEVGVVVDVVVGVVVVVKVVVVVGVVVVGVVVVVVVGVVVVVVGVVVVVVVGVVVVVEVVVVEVVVGAVDVTAWVQPSSGVLESTADVGVSSVESVIPVKFIGLDKQNFSEKIVNIFFPIIPNKYFRCPKEPSHRDGSFEYHNICFG